MGQKKLEKIFEKIFTDPIKPIKWADITGLMVALGAALKEGDGSRVTFVFEVGRIVLHKPHPENEVKRYVVRNIREFLTKHKINL